MNDWYHSALPCESKPLEDWNVWNRITVFWLNVYFYMYLCTWVWVAEHNLVQCTVVNLRSENLKYILNMIHKVNVAIIFITGHWSPFLASWGITQEELEYEKSKAGHELFKGYMDLLSEPNAFKALAKCYGCGSLRSPKDRWCAVFVVVRLHTACVHDTWHTYLAYILGTFMIGSWIQRNFRTLGSSSSSRSTKQIWSCHPFSNGFNACQLCGTCGARPSHCYLRHTLSELQQLDYQWVCGRNPTEICWHATLFGWIHKHCRLSSSVEHRDGCWAHIFQYNYQWSGDSVSWLATPGCPLCLGMPADGAKVLSVFDRPPHQISSHRESPGNKGGCAGVWHASGRSLSSQFIHAGEPTACFLAITKQQWSRWWSTITWQWWWWRSRWWCSWWPGWMRCFPGTVTSGNQWQYQRHGPSCSFGRWWSVLRSTATWCSCSLLPKVQSSSHPWWNRIGIVNWWIYWWRCRPWLWRRRWSRAYSGLWEWCRFLMSRIFFWPKNESTWLGLVVRCEGYLIWKVLSRHKLLDFKIMNRDRDFRFTD